MRRRWLLIGVLSLTFLLLVPSAAFQFHNPGPDRINDALEVSPSDSPNGKYALINDEDEIELVFGPRNPNMAGEGVNIDTRTPFHDVFTITNNGSEPGKLWFTIDNKGLKFYRGIDSDDSLMGKANAVNLTPNQTLHVGVFVDATDGKVGSVENFSIHAEPLEETDTESDDESDSTSGGFSTFESGPSTSISVTAPDETQRSVSFEGVSPGDILTADLDRLVIDRNVGELVLDELTITAGGDDDDVKLDLSVAESETEPFADKPGLQPLGKLAVDHRHGEIDSTTFGFAADDSYLAAIGIQPEDLEFHRTTGNSSEALHITNVEHLDSAVAIDVDTKGISNVTVVARVPAFRVTETSLDPENITVGENVTVRATVENQGLAAGETNVPITLDGETIASENLRLDPNGSAEVAVEIEPTEPGEYEVAVDNVTVGTLEVTEAESTTTADSEGEVSGTSTTPTGDVDDSSTSTVTTEASQDVETTTTLIEEPAAFKLSDIAGLLGALIMMLSLLLLLSKRPRQ